MNLSELAIATLILGGVLTACYLPMVMAPEKMLEVIRRFPRNTYAGWVLAAVDVAWAAWLTYNTSLGFLNPYKQLLYVIAPVLFVLIILFMNELLAARALGGLMLLVPAPLLDAARWHDSSLRLVVTVIAYIIVIKGMFLIFSPFKLRKTMERFINSEAQCRTWGSVGLGMAVVLICLALTVY